MVQLLLLRVSIFTFRFLKGSQLIAGVCKYKILTTVSGLVLKPDLKASSGQRLYLVLQIRGELRYSFTYPNVLKYWDTKKILNFPFVPNGKFIILRCSKIRANYSLILMCSNIGTPNNHHFPFRTNGKVVVLGVPILKHLRYI